MAETKINFSSPSVLITETDNSGLPAETSEFGPVIFGRTQRGPGMRPVVVNSFSEFVEMFGAPLPGGEGGDVWREGNKAAPLYAAYMAQAWLRAGVGPATIVRFLGEQNGDYVANAGEAGWKTAASITSNPATNGGAYGLFLIDSGSSTQNIQGVLGAVWYLNEGSIALSGTIRGESVTTTGSAILIESTGPDKEFRAVIMDSAGNLKENTSFNFNRTSAKYVRSVFNCNPQLTNGNITTTQNKETYWLGETYERHIDNYVSGAVAGEVYGVILGLASGSMDREHMQGSWKNCETGWFVGQDLSTNVADYVVEQQQKLFKLVSLDAPEWTQSNLKVSVSDVTGSSNTANPYGTFTLTLRMARDTDKAPEIVERYTNCNLNPNSSDYVAAKVGDKYVDWSYTESRHREYGKYDNKSRFFRISMDQDVDAGAIDPRYLPFGVLGPPRFMGFTVISGTNAALNPGAAAPFANKTFSDAFVKGGNNIAASYVDSFYANNFFMVYPEVAPGQRTLDFTGSFVFPALSLRNSASDGGISDPKNAYFGIQPYQSATSTKFDKGYGDYLRSLPMDVSSFASTTSPPNGLEYSFAFSLDDIETSGSSVAYWTSGSRAAGTSLTAISSSWEEVLNQGVNKFTTCFHGGFDGIDITEKEPFRNTALAGVTATTSYEYNTIKRAIDTVADPEVVDCNLMAAPGITESTLTDHLISVCENRGDALAVIDLPGDFVPSTENTLSHAARVGDVDLTVSNLKNREVNSSYGCSYYPWVQIRDTETGNLTFVPPSVVAIGTMASAQAKSELWIAPAGFNRGGLTEGAGGIPVIDTVTRLSSKERDKLYASNINPIAKFSGEGTIVIWGQKTMLTAPLNSALSRINVRRMMIFLKKKIERIASRTLFEQNSQATWSALKNKIEPLLSSVKSRFGLNSYKVVIVNEQDLSLKDTNVLLGRIYLVPTRSIEHIVLEFNVTRSGTGTGIAGFND